MKNKMKNLIWSLGFLCFMTIGHSASAKDCFSFDGKVFEIETLKKNTLSITQQDNKALSQWFFCSTKGKLTTCSGDDDSGVFELEGDLIRITSPVTLGTPDGPSFELVSSKPLVFKSCK